MRAEAAFQGLFRPQLSLASTSSGQGHPGMLQPAVEATQGLGSSPGVAQGSHDPGGTWGLDAVYFSWGTHSSPPEGHPDFLAGFSFVGQAAEHSRSQGRRGQSKGYSPDAVIHAV